MKYLAVVMCLCLARSGNSHNELYEGGACSVEGAEGICTDIRNCTSALMAQRKGNMSEVCLFSGTDPIVCCFDKEVTTAPAVTTSKQWSISAAPPATTPSAIPAPESADSKFFGEEVHPVNETFVTEETEKCPPIPSNETAPRTGQKAWDKCIEYQEKLVFPCNASQNLRYNNCWNDNTLDIWLLNSEIAFEGEFPHMALIGYGSDATNLSFLCGGSLISDQFVLTAGRCIYHRDLGPISYVLLGQLKKSGFQQSQLHRVRRVYMHPQYTPYRKYNDIALLQLETPLNLTNMTVPACLDVGDAGNEEVATATAWSTRFRGLSGDILQKVDLNKFTDMECAARYLPSRYMPWGFDTASQICYGDRELSRDACQADSGSPLQVQHKRIRCMYSVVGVTSFGRACGVRGEPALYTRIAHYLPWIEALVWPDN